MRTTPCKEKVSFNYQPNLVGALHKWIGPNVLHGKLSLYSFSWLMNAKVAEGGLTFPDGARFFISFHEEAYLKRVLQSMMKDPAVCFGMNVTDVEIEEEPNLKGRDLFRCASPIFVKRPEGEREHHYTFHDDRAGDFLTETLLHKMDIAGLARDESLRIRFHKTDPKAKVKLVDYKGIKNKVNRCSVIIEGKQETKVFAWNVGIGNSTGVGFGAIY